MDVTTLRRGATTFVMGTDGDFSAGTIGTAGAFKLLVRHHLAKYL